MGMGKIRNHRTFIKGIPVSAIVDGGGNKVDISTTSLTSGEPLINLSGAMTTAPEAYMQYHVHDEVTATSCSANIWTKLSGATVYHTSSYSASFYQTSGSSIWGYGSQVFPGRYTYNGSQPRRFLAQASVSIYSGLNNGQDCEMEMAFAKNNSILSGSIVKAPLTTKNALHLFRTSTVVHMEQYDYLDIQVRLTGTAVVTGSYSTVSITKVL